MTSGMVYDIPKDVKYANLRIAFSDKELQTCRVPARSLRREMMLEKNKNILSDYNYIGYQKFDNKDMHMQMELHWFILAFDMSKCTVSMEN